MGMLDPLNGTEANAKAARHVTSIEEAEKALRKRIRAHTRRAVPISSHPEADSEGLVPPETAIDAPTQEDFEHKQDPTRPKPIVSINGNDVEADEHDKAA